MKVDPSPFSPKVISSTYDKTTFVLTRYTLVEDVWVRQVKSPKAPTNAEPPFEPAEIYSTSPSSLQHIQQGLEGLRSMLTSCRNKFTRSEK